VFSRIVDYSAVAENFIKMGDLSLGFIADLWCAKRQKKSKWYTFFSRFNWVCATDAENVFSLNILHNNQNQKSNFFLQRTMSNLLELYI
jgi:hypothetical protein